MKLQKKYLLNLFLSVYHYEELISDSRMFFSLFVKTLIPIPNFPLPFCFIYDNIKNLGWENATYIMVQEGIWRGNLTNCFTNFCVVCYTNHFYLQLLILACNLVRNKKTWNGSNVILLSYLMFWEIVTCIPITNFVSFGYCFSWMITTWIVHHKIAKKTLALSFSLYQCEEFFCVSSLSENIHYWFFHELHKV